jgi:hypothetical protein
VVWEGYGGPNPPSPIPIASLRSLALRVIEARARRSEHRARLVTNRSLVPFVPFHEAWHLHGNDDGRCSRNARSAGLKGNARGGFDVKLIDGDSKSE